jgi:iron complex transport system ATP-binding protein
MLLDVENGSFSYPGSTPVLKNVSFALESGEVMAIMGPNGIGKTTLLKCLMGILKSNAGCSLIDGLDSGEARRRIGYVPQAHRFSFPYSVREMVVFGRAKHMSVFALPGKEDYRIADAALEEVGISRLANKSCNRLSGGQLQMTLIARALAGQPKLLILDEPESHLDFRNQFTILRIITRLAKEKGIACIMNTHYPNHAFRAADQILLLNEDKYVVGQTAEVLTRENIHKYFGVDSAIVSVNAGAKEIKAFVLLDENS